LFLICRYFCRKFADTTTPLKSFQLLDSILIHRQFQPPWNQSTTRRPDHHRRLHFNPNGFLPAVHKTSLVPSPTSITRMERISKQDYSFYYWNNWEYSPPFYPTSLTNSTFYSNTVSDPYSSSYSYY
jgi:hypothetical protein